ncbi:T9SS type A sorting domain-containing protein [Pseudopedobacter beijingensis]|uniref:Por secretion system C-terminal sorting domain-containing protein n=1 Tax=Pseudopedobacter beijingensis TaxID=1207056 RepID=A0ABW4I6L3_9SPHI
MMIRNLLLIFVLFINVRVFSQVTRFVGPESVGSGDGMTAANAADFLNTNFWTDIQLLLQTQPVTVKFIAGIYSRAYTEKRLYLNQKGHAKNQLVLEGDLNNTIFTAPTGYQESAIMIWIYNSRNIIIKNFSFTGNGKVNYVLRMTSGQGGVTKDILVENCHWYDMKGVEYGATGVGQPTTSYVTYKNCSFKRIGSGSGAHMIYNAYGSHHISIIDSHFEDCTGDYVRFRDNLDYGTVSGSTFIRTSGYSNRPFISVPLFNDIDPGDEVFATNYSFTNNVFTNATEAIKFYSSGYDPIGRNHLLTASEGGILSGGTAQQKKNLLLNNFNINTDLIRLDDNTFNIITREVTMESVTNYGSQSRGWTGAVDISELFTNTANLLPWEENYYNLRAGVWNNESRTLYYNLGAGTGGEDKIFTGIQPVKVGGSSISTESIPGFLPYIPETDGGGFARVAYPSSNAAFTLQDMSSDESTLKISSSGSGYPAKFSLYNILKTSPVSSLFFTISFKDSTYTQVLWTCSMGNHTGIDNLFSDGSFLSASSATSNPEVFNAFRWRIARTNPNVIDFQYRNKTLESENASYTTVNIPYFYRGGEFAIEVYANNDEDPKSYTRGGIIYEIPSRAYHIWSNGERILKEIDNYAFPANQLAVGLPINSFMIHGTNSSSTPNPDVIVGDNSAELTIGKIRMDFASIVTLPVTLTSFDVKQQQGNVLLNWATNSEVDNAYFEILRSTDGKGFSEIGNVKGTGNSRSVNSYTFTDKYPLEGLNYYRLRQVDYDGVGKYSEVKTVNIGFIESETLKVLIPANIKEIHFSYTSQDTGESVLQVLDVQGRKYTEEKIQLKKGENYFFIESSLPSGVYIALLRLKDQAIIAKFIK